MSTAIGLLCAIVLVGVANGATPLLVRPRRPLDVQTRSSEAEPGTHRRRRAVASATDGHRRAVLLVVLTPVVVVLTGPLVGSAGVVSLLVGRQIARRNAERRARAELDALVPELIELILVGIHAGLTPASAVLRLGTAAPEPLVPALRSVEERVRSGDRFADAFTELARRAGHPYQPLVGAIALAERTGDPIGPVLDRLADDARRHRRRLADASSRELPVRLSVPLVCCTLPGFVLLTIAPVLAGALSSLRGAVP